MLLCYLFQYVLYIESRQRGEACSGQFIVNVEGGPDIFICFSSQNVKLGMLSWEDLGGLEKGLLISFSFDCWSSHTILSCHGTRPASLLKYSTM